MGEIHTELVARLVYWSRSFTAGKIEFYFSFKVSPHDRARNQIADVFLRGPYTHLFSIDSDTAPPFDAIDKLLAHDLPFVTAMTPIASFNKELQAWEFFDNCFASREENPDGTFKMTHIAHRHTGLQKVFRCGAACMLIKREVFGKIEKPYFAFEYNKERTQHKRSEDIWFCDKLTDAGFELFADTDVICEHHKELKF